MLKIIKKTRICKRKAFTLVEMLVSIAVFMIVMTVAVGSLVAIIDSNRKAQAIKNVVNNINFALESISKDMRVGTKYYCHTGSDSYSQTENTCINGSDGVKYKNGSGKWVHYRFFDSPTGDMGNIQKCIKTDESDACSNDDWESLTAPTHNVIITNMKFYVLGAGTTGIATRAGWRQPRVIITVEGTAGIKDNIKTTFNIQTTVTQRIREIH